MQRKRREEKFENVRFCVRPLCELQLIAAFDANDIRHHPHLEIMSISLLHFTAFFQGECKSIERGEKYYKSGMWRVSVMPLGRMAHSQSKP